MKKTVTPVILPSKLPSEIGFNKELNLLAYFNGKDEDMVKYPTGSYQNRHLYLTTTNNEIIEGWYIDDTDAVRQSVTEDRNYWMRRHNYRKIIATTDRSLHIPIIHPDFVKYFVEKQGKVGKCEVEYQEFTQYSASVKANGEGASNTIVGSSVIKLINGYVSVIVD